MGDRDLDKSDNYKKPVETCAALVREVEAAQFGTFTANEIKAGAVEVRGRLGCPVEHLDFEKDDVWGKKTIDKKIVADKLAKSELDFAPVPSLYPIANGLIDRVDSNKDGRMSKKEIKNALSGNDLSKKEKHFLDIIEKNKTSIDNDRDGISMSDIKDFDAKIHQYNNELALARKFSPQTAEFARELYQRAKSIDENMDGKFSREELTASYMRVKKEFIWNPTSEGKRELSALNWGMAHYDRLAPDGSEITLQSVRHRILRDLDRNAPRQMRENFLSDSNRYRVERYQQTL